MGSNTTYKCIKIYLNYIRWNFLFWSVIYSSFIKFVYCKKHVLEAEMKLTYTFNSFSINLDYVMSLKYIKIYNIYIKASLNPSPFLFSPLSSGMSR